MEVNKKEIQVLEKSVGSVYEETKVFLIKNEEDCARADELRKKLKTMEKSVEERRTAITKPINDSLKSINDLFRPFKDKIAGAVKHLDTQLVLYTKEQEEKARKEQEKIEKRVEKGTMKAETAMEKISNMDKPTTSRANSSIRKIPKVRIIDVSLVPREYLIPDEKKIAQAILHEGAEIPGVEKYEETVVWGKA